MAIKKQSEQFCDLGAEEKLDIIFNNATDGIFIHDNKGVLTDVNQTACDNLGYTKEELISMGIPKIDAPEFALRIPERIKSILKNGRAVFESVHVRKDKTLMPVEVNARTITYSGKPAIMSFVRDITDRKNAEEKIKKAKEVAEAYLEVSSELIFSLNTKGTIVLLNNNGHRLLGYEPGELIGKNWFDTCIPKKIRTDVKGVFEKLMNGDIKSVKVYENSVLTKDGEEKILLWYNSLTKDENGKIDGIISSARDITQQKTAELALLEKNRQLSEAQKLARTGSYSLDVASEMWQGSETLNEIFGISENYQRDLEGWANLIIPEERDAMINYLKNDVLKKRRPFDRNFRIVRVSDSEIRWVHGLGNFGFDPKGKIVTLFGTLQDITEVKLSEEKEAEEKERIRQSELRYRGLIENTPMCIKVFDKDGNLKFLNRGGREEHHVKEGDDLLKWDWLGTVKPEYIPAAKKVFEEAFKGKTGEVEFEHTEDSLAHPWCHGLISPILDEKGKVVSVLFYSTNVTELKRNEIKAKESELMFKTLLNSLPLCIKWFDAKGNLISINKGGREEHFLTKMPEEEIKNWNYLTCIEPAYHKLIKENVAEALKGVPKMFIIEHTPGTSMGRWCSSELLPVLDINNKVKYVLFISRDITAEKEEEGKKIAHAKELEKMNQLMIGRENKMIELKEKLKEIELRSQINNNHNNNK